MCLLFCPWSKSNRTRPSPIYHLKKHYITISFSFRIWWNFGLRSKFGTNKCKTTDNSKRNMLFDFFTFEFILYFYIRLSYSNSQNVWWFIKLEIYGILIVFQMLKFFKFAIFRNWTMSEIWWFPNLWNLGNSWNFPNFKLSGFFEFQIFEIFKISNTVKPFLSHFLLSYRAAPLSRMRQLAHSCWF